VGDNNEQTQQEGEVPSATPLDEIRAEIAKEVEVKRLFKRFPRGQRRLAAEYRPARKREVREAAAAENDEYLMGECLVRILIEDKARADASTPEGAVGLVPLGEWVGRPDLDPLRFDNRLAEVLGLEQSGDPRKIALELFEGNDLQLAEQAGEIAAWSLDTTDKTYQDFSAAS
jgi:hypothetical protein